MSVSTNRRIVGAAAVAGLITTGIAAVTTTAVAGPAAAATCNQQSSATKQDISTVGIKYTYSKTVTATAAAGAEVSYTVQFSTNSPGNPYISVISDHAPAGFPKPTVKVTAYHLGLGAQTESVDAFANGTDTWRISNAGWFVDAGNPLTAVFTYKVPSSFAVGQQITSGGVGWAGTVGSSNELPNLTSCFTVRAPNAGEVASGSLDANGFGSSDNGPASGGVIGSWLDQLKGS
ncbi:hypothetical protein [Jongsikchunia kroppenstedtii]|uniref:hypothetical protein n=1 Tax=Jongsikchunia kroppenstedtii TaxID=1121721 RepID=UPI000373C9A6|nr:hypothetical protein [Jongsikchunia kroppenstedtii]